MQHRNADNDSKTCLQPDLSLLLDLSPTVQSKQFVCDSSQINDRLVCGKCILGLLHPSMFSHRIIILFLEEGPIQFAGWILYSWLCRTWPLLLQWLFMENIEWSQYMGVLL